MKTLQSELKSEISAQRRFSFKYLLLDNNGYRDVKECDKTV